MPRTAERKAIEAYVDAIKAGARVSASVAGVEADALTEALRESESFSVSNFQGQADTSCFWVTLHVKSVNVEARVVLADRSSSGEVTAASLARECECPIDSDQPCGLR